MSIEQELELTKSRLAVAEAELDRLYNVEFVHGGCEMLRRKDNEYLLARCESAEPELARLRAVVAAVEARANEYEHDDWCCAKGCAGPGFCSGCEGGEANCRCWRSDIMHVVYGTPRRAALGAAVTPTPEATTDESDEMNHCCFAGCTNVTCGRCGKTYCANFPMHDCRSAAVTGHPTDEPPTCEHGKTGPHHWNEEGTYSNGPGIECPGPAGRLVPQPADRREWIQDDVPDLLAAMGGLVVPQRDDELPEPCGDCGQYMRQIDGGSGLSASDAPIYSCRKAEAGMCPAMNPAGRVPVAPVVPQQDDDEAER